jgi:hypothetical protein
MCSIIIDCDSTWYKSALWMRAKVLRINSTNAYPMFDINDSQSVCLNFLPPISC